MNTSIRSKIYWWLERPERSASGPKIIEIALIVLIVLNVTAVILETVDTVYSDWQVVFDIFEMFSVAIFITEYLLRLWVSIENPEVDTRWQWFRSPIAIVDLLAILPTLLYFILPVDLRVLRAFRLLRILKLTRYSPALRMLLDVFEEEAGAFFAGFFILILMLVLAASGAWIAEHEAQPEDFGSIPAAMWWAVATLTTVGYGDVTPVTVAGKIFGAMITIVGIGMAALPAGIIASGLNDQIHRRRNCMIREFRKALEDGNICEQEEEEIELVRKELGLSHRMANEIRQQVESEQTQSEGRCKTCGQPIDTI